MTKRDPDAIFHIHEEFHSHCRRNGAADQGAGKPGVERGARIVAHPWSDPDYQTRPLDDAIAFSATSAEAYRAP